MFGLYLKLEIVKIAYFLFRLNHFFLLKEKYNRQLKKLCPNYCLKDGKKNVLVVDRNSLFEQHKGSLLNGVDFKNIRLFVYKQDGKLYQYYNLNRCEALEEIAIYQIGRFKFDLMLDLFTEVKDSFAVLKKNKLFPKKKAKLNILCVFNEKSIHSQQHWQIVDEYFDALCAPSAHEAKYLIGKGIKTPVFSAFDMKQEQSETWQSQPAPVDMSVYCQFLHTVLLPANISLQKENEISSFGIKTSSMTLYKKYQQYMQHQKIFVVCPCVDSGFFSNFNKYVSHLCYAADDAILIPDWRVKTLQQNAFSHTQKNQFSSWCYGSEKDGNVFLKFFQNPYPEVLTEKLLQTNSMYNKASEVIEYFDFNEKQEPFLTYINSYNLYDDAEYFPVFRRKYHEVLEKYIHLQPCLQKTIDDFYNKNLKGKFVVSAFIRCKGHATELKEGSPTLDLWNEKLLEILNKEKVMVQSDSWRFFIAADNDDAALYFSKKYPHNVVFQKMQRLTTAQEQEYEAAKKKHGKDLAGYELQHRKAANKESHSVQNGTEVIFDVYLAASADYLIFTNSNMSTAASYINPQLKMVYCKK